MLHRSRKFFSGFLNASRRQRMGRSPALSLLRQLRDKSTKMSNYAVNQARLYLKQLLEKNKRYVVQPATKAKCHELAQTLSMTRFASIPYRYKAFWKELDYVKSGLLFRREIKIEELGVAFLFLGELYAWSIVGEVVGRGNTITGYYVD